MEFPGRHANPTSFTGLFSRIGGRAIKIRKNTLCALQEQLSAFSDLNASASPAKQLNIEFTFELLDLPAESRLGDAQLLSGAVKMQLVAEYRKISQLPYFHVEVQVSDNV